MAAETYSVLLDWANDGSYAGDSQPVLNAQGVQIKGGRESARQFAPMRPTKATWRSDNRDLRFTDPAGSIGANLKPFRKAQISSNANLGGGEFPLFTGYTDSWQVSADNYPLVVADFAAFDLLGRLAETTISTQVLQNVTTDVAAQTVLAAAGIVTSVIVETGATTLGYWWVDNQTALAALNDIALHEGGTFFIDRYGYFRFWNRYHYLDDTTVTATLADSTHVKKVAWRSTARDVINRAVVSCPVYTAGSTAVIWSLGATLTLAANEVVVFQVSSSDPFINAINPAVGVDFFYTALPAPTLALYATSGKATHLTVTNGVSPNTVTGIQVRAQPLTKTRTVEWFSEDIASQADYGIKEYRATLEHLSDPNVGKDFADYMLLRYAKPLEAIEVTLKAGTGDSAEAVLATEVNAFFGDRVALSLASVGVAWEGFIQAYDHRIRGEFHEATFTVERSYPDSMLTLDDNVYGLLDDNAVGW